MGDENQAPSQPICVGCGFALTTEYWVGVEPDLCHRCFAVFSRIANRWRSKLTDERTARHVDFCYNYAAKFAHGAPGHMDYMTIAAIGMLLDDPVRVLR